MRQPAAAVALACLLVLAGCGASPAPESPTEPAVDPPDSSTPSPADEASPTATRSPSPTASPTPTPGVQTPTGDPADIPVRNGTLPVDHEQVYHDVQTVAGRTASPPRQVVLLGERAGDPGFGAVNGDFQQTMLGVAPPSPDDGPRVTGVALATRGASRAYLLKVLAHEYVHNIQFQLVTDTEGFRLAFDARTHQRQRLGAAVVEGSASYLADAYMREHTNYTDAEIRRAGFQYANLSGADRYDMAIYHFGRQYVAARSDSPRDHWSVYRNPPATTEELLHRLPPGSEPPRALSVGVEGDGWTVDDRDTMGELFVRLTLRSQLSRERAAAGAAGWGNDTLLRLDGGDRSAYAWTLRWDDAANATEFAAAFRAYLDGRATRAGDVWTATDATFDLRIVGDETAVVLVGPEPFVRNAGVDGSGGNVTVSPPA